MHAAVIGLGLGKVHARVYDRREEIKTISLCDRNENAANALADTLQKPANRYSRIDDLFAAESVDVASIVTPDQFHREHAEAAFAAGAHVLLTKPIATSLGDAQGICRAAEASGRQLMVVHERRFRPLYTRARELIRTGAVGDLAYVRLEMLQNAEKKFARAPWYASKEAGRTAITGSGIHQVDLVRWLSGQEFVSVRALGNRIGPIDFHHNKTVVALFELDGGAIAEVVFTYEATPPLGGESMTIIGGKGMIRGNAYRSRTGMSETLSTEAMDEFAGSERAIEACLDALVNGQPGPVSGEDATRSLAAAIAADQSCASGMTAYPAVMPRC
jgi:predicted dehydrogenase